MHDPFCLALISLENHNFSKVKETSSSLQAKPSGLGMPVAKEDPDIEPATSEGQDRGLNTYLW